MINTNIKSKKLLLILLGIIGSIGFVLWFYFTQLFGMSGSDIGRCPSALAGVKTAQEIFMYDHNRYAKSLSELNYYKGRVYIEQIKVAQYCNTPMTSSWSKGYYISGYLPGKYETCRWIHTEKSQYVKGVCPPSFSGRRIGPKPNK